MPFLLTVFYSLLIIYSFSFKLVPKRCAVKNNFVQFGIEGLDVILKGGLPPDRLYLIEGESGSGKTTLSLQFLLEGARRGKKSLYIGTAETEEEIRYLAASHGWSLDGVTLFHHKHEEDQAYMEQTVIHPAEVDLPKTMNTLLSVIEKEKPERVVIDSLTEIRLLSREPHWYWKQLLMLKNFFTDRSCTVLLTEIPTGDPTAAIHSIIHGKIILQHTILGYGPDRRRLRVNKIQAMDFFTGYHDYRIVKGGIHCFPRLVAAEHRHTFTPRTVSSGNREFDDFLGGGLDVGTSILFTGPSGTGKSLLTCQCAIASAERGERASLYIFDERIQTLMQRSESVGLELERYYRKGAIAVHQIDPAEMTPGEFSFLVKKEIDAGTTLIAIDSLNGYTYAMPEERFLSLHLHELSSFLNQMKVTTLFIMSTRTFLSGTSEVPFDVSYIADTVLMHQYAEIDGAKEKAISVLKRRSGTHDRRVRKLLITDGGLSVGEPVSGHGGYADTFPEGGSFN
jgi:circadian clock protein KaiC